MRQVNPLDLVETIREGLLVLEPDRASRREEEAANRGGTATAFRRTIFVECGDRNTPGAGLSD